MELKHTILGSLICLLYPAYVYSISIEGISGTKTAGGSEMLRVTCRSSSSDAAIHHSLVLSRNTSYVYQNLVTVADDNGRTVVTWAQEAGNFEHRTEAVATGEKNSGSTVLTVDIPKFECSDAGIYRCSLNGAHSDQTPVEPTPSATATLSVIGRNGNLTLTLTEYTEPGEYIPQRISDYMQDRNEIRDPNVNYPRYRFKAETKVTIECQGDISKSTTRQGTTNFNQNQNHIDWYSLRPGAYSWERYYAPDSNDVETRIIGGGMDSCVQTVLTTLKYTVPYINIDSVGGPAIETRFRCQASSTLGGMSESNQVGISFENPNGGSTINQYALISTSCLVLLIHSIFNIL